MTQKMDEDEGVMNEVDIYGDLLDGDIFGPPSKKRKVDEQTEDYQNLVKENQTLKSKLQRLEKENRAYFNNISALFLTAKNEIEKKNFIIKNLTDKLKQVTKSKSSLSGKEVEDVLTRCQEAFLESQTQLTINEIKKCLRNESLNGINDILDTRKKGRIKFGNISFYYFRDQTCFERGEEVVFDVNKTSSDNKTESVEAKVNPESSSQAFPVDSSDHRQQKIPKPDAPPRLTNHSIAPVPVPVFREDEDASRMSLNGVDEMGFPLNQSTATQEEPDRKRERRKSDKDDRERDRNTRRNSSDERHNSHRYARNNERSPERHRHRRDSNDRSFVRKDYDSRRDDNFRRQGNNNWRTHDNRTRPGRDHNRNHARPSNSSTHIKNSRSRSKSK